MIEFSISFKWNSKDFFVRIRVKWCFLYPQEDVLFTCQVYVVLVSCLNCARIKLIIYDYLFSNNQDTMQLTCVQWCRMESAATADETLTEEWFCVAGPWSLQAITAKESTLYVCSHVVDSDTNVSLPLTRTPASTRRPLRFIATTW